VSQHCPTLVFAAGRVTSGEDGAKSGKQKQALNASVAAGKGSGPKSKSKKASEGQAVSGS